MEIKKLTLQTDKLHTLKYFYTKVLGFSLDDEHHDRFQIKAGSSIIEFTDKDVAGSPFYHFALNIPSNQFREAKEWLKEKLTLLVEEGKDEADFSFWPAHSCYFEDPAGNIVELVARYKENPINHAPFSVNSILNISEIGLVVKDAKKVGEQLEEIGILASEGDHISNSSLNFMQENKNGVFILLTNTGRRWLFSDKESEIFPLKITLDKDIVLGVDEGLEFFIERIIE
ncbi:VOC family protein [Pradoshia eiseniae]|uniref:VOC family protein n=1 Tax=Pradoshia eiseniae TaxID=2064768 RepID=UPI0013752029|nr:VOC family protein [Pradoshia eiseniae]